MKTLKHYFAALVLMMVSFGALAGPNVKDVENAMRAQNWSGAEQMLNQVLEKKPNSAKAHYLLAQTHEQMGQRSLAASDLERAKAADPSLKFASPGAVSKMEKRLNGQTTRYAEQPVQRKQARETQSYSQPTYSAPVTTAAVTQPAAPVVVQNDQKSSGGAGGLLLVILLLAVIGGVGIYLQMRKQKKEEQERIDRGRRALLARAVDLQTRTTELQKTLRYESQEDSQLGLIVSNLVSNATSALSRLKGTTSDGFNASSEERKLNNLENDIHSAEARLAAKDFDGAKEAAAAKKRQEEVEAAERRTAQLRAERQREEETRRAAQAERDRIERERQDRLQAEEDRREREYQQQHVRSGYNGGTRTVEHHHHHSNNSGAGDLLTGVLIGQAISSASHSHGHSHSNHNSDDGWSNRNSTPAYEAPAPRYEEPEAPALDFGGGNSWDNDDDDKRRDSGSSDTGSSNNDDGF